MDFTSLVRSRRMIRRYASEPVDPVAVERILAAGLRGPSAGFSQGVDLLLLDDAASRARFWAATSPSPAAPDAWLRGMSAAPVLVLVVADRDAYLDRYTEPDKGWADRSQSHWPIPYWHVDAGMAAMLMLLAVVDEGLGACFFGVPEGRELAACAEFGIPVERFLVGVVSIGHPAPTQPGGSGTTRPRRPSSEAVHRGVW